MICRCPFTSISSGVLKPRAGTVAFDGQDITSMPSAEVVKLGIVQMAGGRATFPGLSIEENLRVGASVVPRSDRAARIEEALALFPWLSERRAQQAGSLSGGEQQMLGLARALIAKPRLLMIDELSLGLAPVVVTQLLDVIERLRREGLTVLLVEQPRLGRRVVALEPLEPRNPRVAVSLLPASFGRVEVPPQLLRVGVGEAERTQSAQALVGVHASLSRRAAAI